MSTQMKQRIESVSEIIVKSVGLEEHIKLLEEDKFSLMQKFEQLEKQHEGLKIEYGILEKVNQDNDALRNEKSELFELLKNKEMVIIEMKKNYQFYFNKGSFEENVNNPQFDDHVCITGTISDNLPNDNTKKIVNELLNNDDVAATESIRELLTKCREDYGKLLKEYQQNLEELEFLRTWRLEHEENQEEEQAAIEDETENEENILHSNQRINDDNNQGQDDEEIGIGNEINTEKSKTNEDDNTPNNEYTQAIIDEEFFFGNKSVEGSYNPQIMGNDDEIVDGMVAEMIEENDQNSNIDDELQDNTASLLKIQENFNNEKLLLETKITELESFYLELIEKIFGWKIIQEDSGLSFSTKFLKNGDKKYFGVLTPEAQLLDCPAVREQLRANPHLYEYLKPELMPIFLANAITIGNADDS